MKLFQVHSVFFSFAFGKPADDFTHAYLFPTIVAIDICVNKKLELIIIYLLLAHNHLL